MKTYRITLNVGKSKYVVSFCDGVKTHKDGSDFFDVVIFSSLKKLNSFVDGLVKDNYVPQ